VLFRSYISIFIPSRFGESSWEYQMAGALVERGAVPLVAAAMVFYGVYSQRERGILKIIAWFSCLGGLLYLLLVPLCLSAAWRINTSNERQISSTVTQQLNQLQERKAQLGRATARDLDNVFTLLRRKGSLQGIKNPQELRSRLFSEIAKVEGQIRSQADTTRTASRLDLVKNATKWSLSALVTGILFLLLWWVNYRQYQAEELREEEQEFETLQAMGVNMEEF